VSSEHFAPFSSWHQGSGHFLNNRRGAVAVLVSPSRTHSCVDSPLRNYGNCDEPDGPIWRSVSTSNGGRVATFAYGSPRDAAAVDVLRCVEHQVLPSRPRESVITGKIAVSLELGREGREEPSGHFHRSWSRGEGPTSRHGFSVWLPKFDLLLVSRDATLVADFANLWR
jgi:hypothetical protein